MPHFLDQIDGYWEAVARETVGRDAAYLRLSRLVAGVELRPLTLREYLHLSVEASPFVVGGKATRGDVCFVLWRNRAEQHPDDDPKAFAARFDELPMEFLTASCREYVDLALADAPKGGGGGAGFYSLATSILDAKQVEHRRSHEEIMDSPMAELLQDLRVIQQRRNPGALLFNRSDRLKSEWLQRQNEVAKTTNGDASPGSRQ